MLGDYLKKARLRKNLSQTQFAKLLGTSQSYYSRLEKSRVKPGLQMVSKIALALNVEESFIRSLL